MRNCGGTTSPRSAHGRRDRSSIRARLASQPAGDITQARISAIVADIRARLQLSPSAAEVWDFVEDLAIDWALTPAAAAERVDSGEGLEHAILADLGYRLGCGMRELVLDDTLTHAEQITATRHARLGTVLSLRLSRLALDLDAPADLPRIVRGKKQS